MLTCPQLPISVNYLVDSRTVMVELFAHRAAPSRWIAIFFRKLPYFDDAHGVGGVQNSRRVRQRICVQGLYWTCMCRKRADRVQWLSILIRREVPMRRVNVIPYMTWPVSSDQNLSVLSELLEINKAREGTTQSDLTKSEWAGVDEISSFVCNTARKAFSEYHVRYWQEAMYLRVPNLDRLYWLGQCLRNIL